MSYGYPTLDVERVRKLTGTSTTARPRILSPSVIAGTSVTVVWENNDVVADTYRVIIGLASGQNQVADSGNIPSTTTYTFTNLSYTTENVIITLYYRLGDSPFRGIAVSVPVTYQPPVIDNNNDGPRIWDDTDIWDDNEVWVG